MKLYGLGAKLLASVGRVTDSVNAILRVNQLGELLLGEPYYLNLAREGSLFVASNPTIGTAVALTVAAQTSFSATAPAFLLRNSDATKDAIVRRINLLCTTVGTAGTDLQFAIVVDSANRYSSGGAARTPVNARADSGTAASVAFYDASTAIVASASGSSARTIARNRLRTAIPVIGDIYSLLCGCDNVPEMGAVSGSAAQKMTLVTAPVVIPPGGTALVYLWSTAQTAAPTYEYTVEWAER